MEVIGPNYCAMNTQHIGADYVKNQGFNGNQSKSGLERRIY